MPYFISKIKLIINVKKRVKKNVFVYTQANLL